MSGEYQFIAITLCFTLTWSGSTCDGLTISEIDLFSNYLYLCRYCYIDALHGR